ncbi:MAG: molybdopterin-dependent oxidoreductase [Pseudorhodobacter sp.]|nr:molybdopterin-dependent oxidoreductase [Pseudorhodobacter sp.]
MSKYDSLPKTTPARLTTTRRGLLTGVAGFATFALMGASKSLDLVLPPLSELITLSNADSEGLINVFMRDGQVVSVGSLDPPNNLASPMGLNWYGRAIAPDRITTPMIRVDWQPGGSGGNRETRGEPRYRAATWDEALTLVAAELKRTKETYGNEAILGQVVAGWQTAGSFHSKNSQIGRFLGLYGGFTSLVGNKSFACWQWAAPYSWGLQYPEDSMADSLDNTNGIIFWASDPMDCLKVRGPSYGRVRDWLSKLKQKGVKFTTIDPLFTETAQMSDEWIAIRPGSDVALMAAMAYHLISENKVDMEFLDKYVVGYEPFRQYIMGETDGVEKTAEWASARTDMSVEAINALATYYADTPRVKIAAARGIQRCDHGEQNVRMVITLALIKGEMGLPGGGMTFEIPGFSGLGDAKVIGRGPGGYPASSNPVTQSILEQHLASALEGTHPEMVHNGERWAYPEEGKSPIKLAYWMGGSTLNQHDDVNENLRSLASLETIIVQDSWWTPAARAADIVLPAATLFERNDMTRFWRYVVYQHKIIDPVGEARSDFEIFADLAKRLGFYDELTMGLETEDAWLRKLYSMSDVDLSYEDFQKVGFVKLPIDETPYVAFSAFREDPVANPLKTASGKFEIFSETIASYNYDDCPASPEFIEPFEWLGSEKVADYPLHIVNKHPLYRRHSSYDNVQELHSLSKINGFEPIYINTKDAEARGIQDGDVVRVFNERGAVLCGAYVTDRIRPSVILLQQGSWYSPTEPGKIGSVDRGGCANVLTAQRGTSQLAQGPVCHDSLAQVEKYDGDAVPNDYAPIVAMM